MFFCIYSGSCFYSGGQTRLNEICTFKLIFTWKIRINCPQNNNDFNQGVLYFWSKFGDPSLNGWRVHTDKLVIDTIHRYIPTQMYATTTPKAHIYTQWDFLYWSDDILILNQGWRESCTTLSRDWPVHLELVPQNCIEPEHPVIIYHISSEDRGPI